MEDSKPNKIDFGAIIKCITDNRIRFFKTMVPAFFVGIVIAFSIPKEYTTSVVLAPESTENGLGGDVSSLASMVGVNLGTGTSSDAFYPEIYPNIFSSNNFAIPLWNIKVSTSDGQLATTLYDYLAKHQKTAWWNFWRKWVAAMMSHSKSVTNSNNVGSSGTTDTSGIVRLTEEQEAVTDAIKSMAVCRVDQKTNIITIDVTAQDPLVCATVADSVQKNLQRYITVYRTKKAKNDLNYTQRLYERAKTDFESARQRFGAYSDANTEVILQSYKLKQEDLENDMQLKYNMYSQLAQQLQLAKAKVQERTPAFTIIQSAEVPLKKSKPRRGLIILALLALSFSLTLAYSMKDERMESKTVKA